jgi:uncharacterized membrane protein
MENMKDDMSAHDHAMMGGKNEATQYTCPMHPEVISDKPGKCPKCGMTLVKKEAAKKEADGENMLDNDMSGMEQGKPAPKKDAGSKSMAGHDMGAMDMGEKDPAEIKQMVIAFHEKIIWTHLTNVLLGVFLVMAPVTFGYKSSGMFYSDLISGALLIVFGLFSLNPFRLWAPWAACFVGIWLLFAPLIFWAPDAASYFTDSIIGMLVISLSVLIPEMPGMMAMMMKMPPGPETPPGWSYNPSSWLQRTPIIVLGFIGFFASRYLTAFQLGYIDHVWDPFFGGGTEKVLTSAVSKSFPISDGGLGNVAYTIEALMGFMGMSNRWRTMPWMVAFFGVLVIPLGVVSIVLITLQPVSVGFWCSVCLLTAIAMLIMIPLTLDEVVAMIQFIVKRTKEGKPFWRTFWMGDTIEGGGKDNRSPSFIGPLNKTVPSMMWGVNIPWNLLISTAIGIGLMFAPYLFSIQKPMADQFTTLGALVVTFTVIAMAEVGRTIRFLNIAFAVWLIAASIILKDSSGNALWIAITSGVLLIGLSFPKGKIRESYGAFDRYII